MTCSAPRRRHEMRARAMSEEAGLLAKLGLAIAAGWFGALARLARRGDRRLTLALVVLETPGAVACGLMGAGLLHALGFTDAMVMAGAAAAAGTIGSAALGDLALAVLRRGQRP